MVARVLNDGTTYRLGQRLAVPDATLMAVGVMLEGEAVKLGKPTPVFKLPADAGGWDSSWAAIPDFTSWSRRRMRRISGFGF